MNNYIKKIIKILPGLLCNICLGLFAIKVTSLCKFSFVAGSWHAMFSGATISVPMVGLFSGGLTSLVICVLNILGRYYLFGIYSFHILAFYIPGLCAAFYFAYNNIVTRLLIPSACIGLFVMHPVGKYAFAYTLFWVIPIVIYFIKSNHIFFHALASSCIAHAVGSVIWLYALPMNHHFWNSLIPVVFLERMLITCGMVIAYAILCFLQDKVASFFSMYTLPVGSKK